MHNIDEIESYFKGKIISLEEKDKTRNKCLALDLVLGDKTILNIFLKIFNKSSDFQHELNCYKFIQENKLLKLPEILFIGENALLTRRIENNISLDMRKVIKDIANLHISSYYLFGKSLNALQIYDNPRGDLIKRIYDKEKLVRNFWKDINGLVKYLEDKSKATFNLPRVLNHGDLHKRNILSNEERNFYVDLELSCLEYPTWDLAKILFGYNYDETLKFIELYKLEAGHILESFDINQTSKDLYTSEIDKSYHFDSLYRNIGMGIGIQEKSKYSNLIPKTLPQLTELITYNIGC